MGAAEGRDVDAKPSPDESKAALERVLASDRFRASARLQTFLEYIVDERLSGREAGIKAYSIATRAFGFSDRFDPQSDPYIRILARRLRRALAHYYEEDGRLDPVVIRVPRGGYVPEFLRRSETMVERAPPERVRDPAVIETPGLAVMVFDDLTGDPSLAHLATGLAEEILSDVTKFRELRVVGLLWPDRIEGGDGLQDALLNAYHVQFVLFGRVMRAGEMLELHVRLKDVESGSNLWADSYALDPATHDLFGVMRAVTGQVTATIADMGGEIVRSLLAETAERAPAELTAYQAVLKGYHWALVLTEDAYHEAREALEHAVSAAPNYALARAILSDMYFSAYQSAMDPDESLLDRAERLALEAVSLDPECHDARWTLGQVELVKGHVERFFQEYETAIALNPYKASTLGSYALYLVGLEQWDRATELIDRAESLSPHHPAWFQIVPFMVHYRSGELDQAMRAASGIVMPGLPWGPMFRAAALGRLGRAHEARGEWEVALARRPELGVHAREMLARLFHSADNVEAILEGLYLAGLEPSASDEGPMRIVT